MKYTSYYITLMGYCMAVALRFEKAMNASSFPEKSRWMRVAFNKVSMSEINQQFQI